MFGFAASDVVVRMQTALRLLKDEVTDVKLLYLGVCTTIISGGAMLLVPGQAVAPGVVDTVLLIMLGAALCVTM